MEAAGAAAEAPKTAAETEGATTEESKGGGIITGRVCPIHEPRQLSDVQFHGVGLGWTGNSFREWQL